MSPNIDEIGFSIHPTAVSQLKSEDVKSEGPSFGEWFNRSLQTVNQMSNQADHAAQKLITGENKDIHGTMIEMQKAGIAMNLITEVRNKIVAAYEEIKRMQF